MSSSTSKTSHHEKRFSWFKTPNEMADLPSLRDGMLPPQELELRRQGACFIHDMVERLNSNVREARAKISHNCHCVAIIQMHRFFLLHSFKFFDPRDVGAACLFMTSKSEECPRKLEHIIKVWFMLKFQTELRNKKLEITSDIDAEIIKSGSDYIVFLEGIVLQTLGFNDLSFELPHFHIINAMNRIAPNIPKLPQVAYWFATDILHMTDWCVRYAFKIIACVCIKIACVYANFEISNCQYGPTWFKEIYQELDEDLLNKLTDEFLTIYRTADSAHRARMHKRLGKDIGQIFPQKREPKPEPADISHSNSMVSNSLSSNQPPNNRAPSPKSFHLQPPPPPPELTKHHPPPPSEKNAEIMKKNGHDIKVKKEVSNTNTTGFFGPTSGAFVSTSDSLSKETDHETRTKKLDLDTYKRRKKENSDRLHSDSPSAATDPKLDKEVGKNYNSQKSPFDQSLNDRIHPPKAPLLLPPPAPPELGKHSSSEEIKVKKEISSDITSSLDPTSAEANEGRPKDHETKKKKLDLDAYKRRKQEQNDRRPHAESYSSTSMKEYKLYPTTYE